MSTGNELEGVAAIRELRIEGEPERVVLVRVGTPHRLSAEGSGSCVCPYQITGVGDGSIRTATGYDTLHALRRALRAIDGELQQFNLALGERLRWRHRPPGQYMLPPVAPPPWNEGPKKADTAPSDDKGAGSVGC